MGSSAPDEAPAPRVCDRPPPPPPPPPSSTIRSPRISVVYRLLPSLSSHCRVCRRPSTYICFPFVRYSFRLSAVLPQRTTRCHSVFSCFWPPLSFHTSVVARLSVATAAPPGVNRISASRPRLPTRITLLTLPIQPILSRVQPFWDAPVPASITSSRRRRTLFLLRPHSQSCASAATVS